MALHIFCLPRWRRIIKCSRKFGIKFGKKKKEEKQINHDMDKYMKISLMLVVLIIALLAIFWTPTYMPMPPREFRPGYIIRGDIELYYTAKTVISTINIALLVCLLIIYVGIYQKTKSDFTIGLIIFSSVLLLNVLSSNPLIHGVFGFSAYGLGPFAMLPDLFTCVALAVLLYLSVRY